MGLLSGVLAILLWQSSASCVVFTALLVKRLESLERDYLNPYAVCRLQNRLAVPEIVACASCGMLFVVMGYIVAPFLSLAMLAWHAKRWRDGDLWLDQTEIFRRDNLARAKRDALIRMVLYLPLFAAGFCVVLESVLLPCWAWLFGAVAEQHQAVKPPQAPVDGASIQAAKQVDHALNAAKRNAGKMANLFGGVGRSKPPIPLKKIPRNPKLGPHFGPNFGKKKPNGF